MLDANFQVADFVDAPGKAQRALEPAGADGLDAKSGKQCHRAVHIGRDVGQGALVFVAPAQAGLPL